MKIAFRSITFWIFAGLFLGILCGEIFGESIIPLADMFSGIFLRLLRMAIMPLIVASIISGVIKVGSRHKLGLLGMRTFTYYIASTLMAILTGQILVNIFQPGKGSTIQLEQAPDEIPALTQGFGDIIKSIIPENPFQSLMNGDVLPVIFFSILLGYFLTQINDEYKIQMNNLFSGFFEAMMKMTRFIIWSAPFGVFGINAKIVATTGFEAFVTLGYYFSIVLVGLTIHAFVNLPLLMYFITRKNPFYHYKGMPSALVTAFSTCSTIVTLPLTIQAVTEHSRVSKKIASFVLPIGATVNMDGTALYECVAAIFIAQVYGFELTFVHQLIIVVTALLASIGAASVPMSGLVMMSIILSAVGLPLEGVALILAVDRVLDMFRTMVNVLSDSVGSVVVAKLEGEDVLGES
ncbi:dicarboxylate/amino acid:cation symporter [candidate division KSB1 bacterium]